MNIFQYIISEELQKHNNTYFRLGLEEKDERSRRLIRSLHFNVLCNAANVEDSLSIFCCEARNQRHPRVQAF